MWQEKTFPACKKKKNKTNFLRREVHKDKVTTQSSDSIAGLM